MAKSKKSSSSSAGRGRVASPNANDFRLSLPLSPSLLVSSQLDMFEDRRRWSPVSFPPAKTFGYRPARFIVKKQPLKTRSRFSHNVGALPSSISFQYPKQTLICVRRKIRKEVLHAIGKSGKNGGRKYRRSEFSLIGC